MKKQAAAVESHLEGKHWLVGDEFTLADLNMFIAFFAAFCFAFDEKTRE